MASRTLEEKYDLLVTAIKANHTCKQERQDFAVARATPIGRHVQPETAKEPAIALLDCFHRLQLNPQELDRRRLVVDCLKKGGNCDQEISAYLK